MSQPDKSSTTSENELPNAATVRKTFVYRGRVYVRPIERGVVLRDAGTGELEIYLDDFAALVGLGEKSAHGEYELEITIKPLDVPTAEIGIFEVDTDPTPSAHKSPHDYQQQLEAKGKRRKRAAQKMIM